MHKGRKKVMKEFEKKMYKNNCFLKKNNKRKKNWNYALLFFLYLFQNS